MGKGGGLLENNSKTKVHNQHQTPARPPTQREIVHPLSGPPSTHTHTHTHTHTLYFLQSNYRGHPSPQNVSITIPGELLKL